MSSETLLSKTINILRFPLTVLVVFIHFDLSSGLTMRGVTYGLNNPAWYFTLIIYINKVLASVAVPLFFMLAGFLFFYNSTFTIEVYKKKLQKRFWSLFVPYVLWNLFALLWGLRCFMPILSSFYRSNMLEVHFSVLRLLNTFFDNNHQGGIIVLPESGGVAINPINSPLWFVRDLMVVTVCSPILYWIIKKVGMLFVITLLILWFTSFISIAYFEQLLTAVSFFAWGGYYSINKIYLDRFFLKYEYVIAMYAIFSFFDLFTYGLSIHSYIHKIGIILGIITAIILSSKLAAVKSYSLLEKLGCSSFFIYAMHKLLVADLGKGLFVLLNIPDDNPFAMLFLYFFVPLCTVLLCYITYLILKRYSPTLCSLLSGGR